MASLSLDEDAATTQKLVLPSRPRRRLRVKLSLPDGVEHSCGVTQPSGDASLEEDLHRAREEAFEEEVFAEVCSAFQSQLHD